MRDDPLLHLHCPASGAAGPLPFAPRQEAADRWRGDLPLADPVGASRQLVRGFDGLASAPIGNALGLDLTRQLHRTATQLTATLRDRLRGQPLPLVGQSAEAGSVLSALHGAAARSYCRTLLEHARGPVTRHLTTGELIEAHHGALSTLGALLIDAGLAYRDPAPGTWQDLHRLYQSAERLGIGTRPCADDRTGESLEMRYLRLVLLGMASPPRLRSGELEWVHEALRRWSREIHLVIPPAPALSPQIWVIDPHDDEPATLGPAWQALDPHDHRILDTTELLPLLRHELTALHEGDPLPDIAPPPVSQDLYRRLTLAWSPATARTFSRGERRERVHLTLGLTQIFRLLDGGATAADHPLAAWAANESAGGLCLLVGNGSGVRVRVGELVAIARPQAETDVEICVVRWLRDTAKGTLELGVETLAPGGVPARVIGAPPPHPRALLLPELRNTGTPPSLLIADVQPPPAAVLELDTGGRRQRIRLGQPDPQPGYTRYPFRSIEPTVSADRAEGGA